MLQQDSACTTSCFRGIWENNVKANVKENMLISSYHRICATLGKVLEYNKHMYLFKLISQILLKQLVAK